MCEQEAVRLKARWAARRAGWNDHYSVQVWLPSGQTASCGAPSPQAALAGTQQWAERMLGRPVHLELMNRQPGSTPRRSRAQQQGGER